MHAQRSDRTHARCCQGHASPWTPPGLDALQELLNAPAPGWRDQASCLSVDAEMFFPAREEDAAAWQIKAAKGLCRQCPARLHCLAASIQPLAQGIWGGMTEAERRRLTERLRAHVADKEREQAERPVA